MNLLSALDVRKRTLGVGHGQVLQPGFEFAPFIARKLKPYSRLNVHEGCVNRLQWHINGTTLASVSDDHTIAVTDVHNLEVQAAGEQFPRVTRTNSVDTQHSGNIFGVCFLAASKLIATGARDTRVCLTDVTERRGVASYMCHSGSVKHVVNDGISDDIFFSASTDGTVRQFDVREPHDCSQSCSNVVISLARASTHTRSGARKKKHLWTEDFVRMDVAQATRWVDLAYRETQWSSQNYDNLEVKAMAINPMRPELIAISASDNLIRIYDRRKMSLRYAMNEGVSMNFTTPELDAIYLPRHFWSDESRVFSTHLAWSPNGERLAVTYENEHIYLFDRHFKGITSVVRTAKAARCQFEATVKEAHISAAIRELGTHVSMCQDSSCVGRNVKKLIYLLLVRSNVGDALLCEHLAREAYKKDKEDPVLIFRRIQACLSLDNYYMSRKLCLRGARLFPEYAEHFDKIRKTCLLLLDEKIRESSFDEVTTTLKSICKSYHITSPERSLNLQSTTPESVNEDEDSDHEMHASIGANMRYATKGWRRWPMAETCLKLEESLTREDRAIDLPESPSESDTMSEGETAAVEYRNIFPIGSEQQIAFQLRGSVDFSSREKHESLHHYSSYEAEGGSSHPLQPGLLYDKYPIPFEPEHALYRAIEDPNWRPNSNCRRFTGHCNFGTDIAEVGFWGNDVLISGSANGTIYLYDTMTGKILDILKGHNENVNCVQVNQQGTMLATSGLDEYVQIWRPYGKTTTTSEEDIENAIKAVQACYNHYSLMAPISVADLSETVLHDVIRSLQSHGEPGNCNIQ